MTQVSYAEVAAQGPKQSPEEAAAPQPPRIEQSTSVSTVSLVDVDTPSVRTVPSDFGDREVQTETQAARLKREAEAAEAKLRVEAQLAKKKVRSRAARADNWLTENFESLSEGASQALVATNLAAVVGLGAFLGYRGWGLYERGRLEWNTVALGLGILSLVGAFEGVFARYIYKAKGSKSKKQ